MDTYEPENLGTYVSSDIMIEQGNEIYDTQSISDKYQTGIPDLDKYLSGGFGKRNSYEFMVIASAPKCYKTTFALKLLSKQVENKVPMMWVLPEMSYGEITNMYRAFYYPDKEKADSFLTDAIDSGALKIVDKKTIDGIDTPKDLQVLIELGLQSGVEIFYIDPLNYILGQATATISEQTKAEKDFSRWIARTMEENKKTAIVVMHNVKDPNQHRQFGMAGSAAFSQQATKTIEIRTESKLPARGEGLTKVVPGQIISVELWKSRGTEQHMFEPLILKAAFNPGHKGVNIEELTPNDIRDVKLAQFLDKNAPDAKQRAIWEPQQDMINLILEK